LKKESSGWQLSNQHLVSISAFVQFLRSAVVGNRTATEIRAHRQFDFQQAQIQDEPPDFLQNERFEFLIGIESFALMKQKAHQLARIVVSISSHFFSFQFSVTSFLIAAVRSAMNWQTQQETGDRKLR